MEDWFGKEGKEVGKEPTEGYGYREEGRGRESRKEGRQEGRWKGSKLSPR